MLHQVAPGARAGLPNPTKTVAKMDAYQLHAFADDYNWDDGDTRLLDVIRHPQCRLATALLVYWRGEPGELAGYRTAKSAPREHRTAVELLREIERGVEQERFERGDIPFDARDDDGVDLSAPDPGIPEAMRQVVDGGAPAVSSKARSGARRGARPRSPRRP